MSIMLANFGKYAISDCPFINMSVIILANDYIRPAQPYMLLSQISWSAIMGEKCFKT